jgi:hypothetical protein
MDSKVIERNSEGVVHVRGNELIVDSVVEQGDAAFMRVGSPYVAGGSGGGGGFALDLLEAGKDPTLSSRTGIAMMTAAKAPDGSIEVVFHILRKKGQSVDADMYKWLRVVSGDTPATTTIEFLAQVKGLPPSPPVVIDTIWAPNGLSFTQQQGDTNFVTYVGSVPWSKKNVTARWSWMTGPLSSRALIRDAEKEPFLAKAWLKKKAAARKRTLARKQTAPAKRKRSR